MFPYRIFGNIARRRANVDFFMQCNCPKEVLYLIPVRLRSYIILMTNISYRLIIIYHSFFSASKRQGENVFSYLIRRSLILIAFFLLCFFHWDKLDFFLYDWALVGRLEKLSLSKESDARPFLGTIMAPPHPCPKWKGRGNSFFLCPALQIIIDL